jgi:hypothetical protein
MMLCYVDVDFKSKNNPFACGSHAHSVDRINTLVAEYTSHCQKMESRMESVCKAVEALTSNFSIQANVIEELNRTVDNYRTTNITQSNDIKRLTLLVETVLSIQQLSSNVEHDVNTVAVHSANGHNKRRHVDSSDNDCSQTEEVSHAVSNDNGSGSESMVVVSQQNDSSDVTSNPQRSTSSFLLPYSERGNVVFDMKMSVGAFIENLMSNRFLKPMLPVQKQARSSAKQIFEWIQGITKEFPDILTFIAKPVPAAGSTNRQAWVLERTELTRKLVKRVL